jgi:hypothetical protein
MTQRNTTTATTSTPNTDTVRSDAGMEQPATAAPQLAPLTPEQQTALQGTAMWKQATKLQQGCLLEDMAACMADELPASEYIDALDTWGGTLAEYLEEQGYELPEEDEQEEPAPATEQAKATAEQAEQAAKLTEEQEQQQRAACQATLKALVTAYRKGERAYREGLLEAGRLCLEYITGRLALGDKRAAAVQAIEGQLAAYASDTVDVNRLVRCYAAYSLLTNGDATLTKAAANVPYGHYRDAWCLLTERVDKDTATERFILLPGYEQQAQAGFAQAVKDGLSGKAVTEKSKNLHRDYAMHQAAKAKAAEQQAKEQAAKLEAQRREQAKAAAEAEEVAKLKARAADMASEDDKDAKREAAKQAQDLAEKQRAQAEALRFQQEQAARDAARAVQEAEQANKLAASAEAKAKPKAAKDAKASETPAKAAPAPECRGENILATLARTAKSGTTKDTAALLAGAVWAAEDPAALLYDLVQALCKVPDAVDMVAEDVVDVMTEAMLDSPAIGGKAKRAMQAARVVLMSKPEKLLATPADPAQHMANGKAPAAVA